MQEEQAIPKIQLIAIDIDGTLLTPQLTITPNTLAAVRAAQDAGVVVTLATARRYNNTRPIAEALGLSIPLITYDGALIIQHPQAKILYTHPFPAEVAQQTVNIMVQHSVQPVVHHIIDTIEEIWTGPANKDTVWIADYFNTFSRTIRRMEYDELCTGHEDPLRVVAFAPQEVITAMVPAVSALNCSWNMIARGNYGSAEMAVMHTHCSKASGLSALADQLHIPLSQVMAIGDNNNDIEMLSEVGWGVAMGHAPAAVRSIARATTTSNTEDGVAKAIERYALRSGTALR